MPLTVFQVLGLTTVLYFVIVAVWIMKMEDLIERREEERHGSVDEIGSGGEV